MASAYMAAYSSVVELGQRRDYFISGGSKFIEMRACCCFMFCCFFFIISLRGFAFSRTPFWHEVNYVFTIC